MRRDRAILALVLLLASHVAAEAQPTRTHGSHSLVWTAAGAGAGFGIGLWAGLTAFDDAIDSDRKVWTSAIVGAAAGGTLGYLLTRGRTKASPSRPRAQQPRLDDVEVRHLAAHARIGADLPVRCGDTLIRCRHADWGIQSSTSR